MTHFFRGARVLNKASALAIGGLCLAGMAACGGGGNSADDAAQTNTTAVAAPGPTATTAALPLAGAPSAPPAVTAPVATTTVAITTVATTTVATTPLAVDGGTNLTGKVPTVAGATTCFYENYNYEGVSFCSNAQRGNISAKLNGLVSAVKVPDGYKLVLFQNAQFSGKTLELTSDAPNLNILDFNNLASSFEMVYTGAPRPSAKKILFIGNSMFHGHFDPTLKYNNSEVTDLNGYNYGGVPGIFKELTKEAGLNYATHIEAESGESLQYHYQNRLSLIKSKPWDVVVMNDYTTLDKDDPGNPAKLIKYSKLIEQAVHGAGNVNGNPTAKVHLMETWARADQLYATPGGHWNGKTMEQMAADLRAAYAEAARQNRGIASVIPVGDAFLRAVTEGAADRNPYNGIDSGKVDVWNTDHYHASAFGSYLEACVLFGRLTGIDPRKLANGSTTAIGLGLTGAQAEVAQNVAAAQLDFPSQSGQ